MRRFLSYLLLFCALLMSFEASATNYPSWRIKNYATNTPRKVENNIRTLVRHLVQPLDDDYDKAKMIAYWIASHINYDDYLYDGEKATKLVKKYNGQSAEELLKSRSGICQDFADLFIEMCDIAGISAGYISGYAYRVGQKPSRRNMKDSGHAWNYFIYKNKKIYVDTTFMARGHTKKSGSSREFAHKKALRDIERANRQKSVVNEFDDYYFDFDYRQERSDKNYIHEEKSQY